MPWLSDNLLKHLQTVADAPDLGATKYRVLEKFAAGGMGTIYLAEDTQLERRVALKVLHATQTASELAARMLREARVLAQLEHPSIVPVHDVGELPDGRVFYVMKFVQGRGLDEYARQEHELPERLRLFQKICEAAAFAHARGVLHRDLKPANIMVGAFGEVLVMDWGLAKIVEGGLKIEVGEARIEDRRSKIVSRESLIEKHQSNIEHPASSIEDQASRLQTQHGTVMGTPAYMSPEQRRGEIEALDQRTDVYALGAILAFLLNPNTREVGLAQKQLVNLHDSSSASPTSLRAPQPRAPKQLLAICAKAMQEDKTQRYSSAQALANDVERFLNGLAVSSYKENPLEKVWRWIKKFQFMILLVLVYLLVRILLLFWLRL